MGPAVSRTDEVSRQSLPATPVRAAGDHGFRLGVEELGKTLVLRLSGPFDLACIGRVEAIFERVPAEQTRRVVLDLSELSSLDSAGLHTILRANERAHNEAFDLVVVRPRGLASRVFTLTRAGRQLKLVDEVSPASGSRWAAARSGLRRAASR